MSGFEQEIKEIFDRYEVHLVISNDQLKLEDKDGNQVELPRAVLKKSYAESVELTFKLDK